MRLVDDDTLWRDGQEVGAMAVALDVVETDHHDRMMFEERHTGRQGFFNSCGAGGGEGDGVKMEVPLEFLLPLLDEVPRAQHSKVADLAAVEQLAHDQAGFDRLADADVVRDEQPHRRKAQRHEQRHELVRARLDGDVAKRAERTGPRAELELKRITQEECARVIAAECGIRFGERGGTRRLRLQIRQERRDVVLGTAERAESQERVRRARLDHPFPPACGEQGTGIEDRGVLGDHAEEPWPNTLAWLAKIAGQEAGSAGNVMRAKPRSAT